MPMFKFNPSMSVDWGCSWPEISLAAHKKTSRSTVVIDDFNLIINILWYCLLLFFHKFSFCDGLVAGDNLVNVCPRVEVDGVYRDQVAVVAVNDSVKVGRAVQ